MPSIQCYWYEDDRSVEELYPDALLQADLHSVMLSGLLCHHSGAKLGVVLVDPPWGEYVRRAPGVGQGKSWSWHEIKNLKDQHGPW